MDSKEPESEEPLSPGNVFAHMLVSLILLLGVWGIEWLKSRFEHGVPTIAAASVATGELAMFAYFIGSLVRACRWALREVDTTFSAFRSAGVVRDTRRGLNSFLGLLREAVPSLHQIQPALRLLFSIFIVAIGALVLWTLLTGSASGLLAANSNKSNFGNHNKMATNSNNSNTSGNMNRFSNSNTSSNANGISTVLEPVGYIDRDEGIVPRITIALVFISEHSGLFAVTGSIVVGLLFLTFVSIQVFRAFSGL
jgi:hypothetical protein